MKLNLYQKTALITIAATFFLIFVGGLVRASGAGLGCPDWPKCYGLWIPPTTVEGLPSEFDESAFNAVKTWTEYVNRLIGVLIGFFDNTYIFVFIQISKVSSCGYDGIIRGFCYGSVSRLAGWTGSKVRINRMGYYNPYAGCYGYRRSTNLCSI